jgi:hypothetical protein
MASLDEKSSSKTGDMNFLPAQVAHARNAKGKKKGQNHGKTPPETRTFGTIMAAQKEV